MAWDNYLKAMSNRKCRLLLKETLLYVYKSDRLLALDLDTEVSFWSIQAGGFIADE
ncbi:MAG: hypothetical protein JWM39_312 [Parcubacteria group bacterium]|nr:hypothetical protein [Parcubacteria group bacterium]